MLQNLLSKTSLSLIHPYELNKEPDSDLYNFTSDHGVKYYCIFKNCTHLLSPVIGIYDIEIFEFEFDYDDSRKNVIGERPVRYDERVSETIIYLLEHFFALKLAVVVYICSSSDGKHNGRNVLFEDWFGRKQGLYQRIPLELEVNIGNDEILNVFACALTRMDFPFMNLLEEELRNEGLGIIANKF